MSQFDVDWIAKYVNHYPDVILDIGSFDGTDALRIKKAYPNSRVIAIEASPVNFEQRVVGTLANTGVECYNYALCDKIGLVEFFPPVSYESKYMGSGSVLSGRQSRGINDYEKVISKQPVVVPGITLEEFGRMHGLKLIDVIHMDVEGAEYLVMKGIGNYRPRIIFCEVAVFSQFSNIPSIEEFSKFMNGLGYKLEKTLEYDNLYVRE